MDSFEQNIKLHHAQGTLVNGIYPIHVPFLQLFYNTPIRYQWLNHSLTTTQLNTLYILLHADITRRR